MALLQRSEYHTAFLSVNLNLEPETRYKKCLQKMCKYPRYQYMIMAFVTVCYVFVVFNTMIGPFVFMNPIFQCRGTQATEEEACGDFRKCEIGNDFTAVYKNEMYCEKEPIRSTVQSIFGLGYIIGKVAFPLISDIIGRRKCILISFLFGLSGMILLLLGIEYNIETLMMVGHTFAGIFGAGIAILTFIYACDFCPERIREICLTTCWVVWGLVEMLFYVLFFYVPHWRFYLTVTLLVPITVIFILILFLQVESPVYALFVKKNPQKFDRIVDQLAWFNRIGEIQSNQIKQQGRRIISLLKTQGGTQIHLKQILSRIFCQKKNFKIVLSLVLMNIGYIFFYYGMQGSMESVGFNFGVNMLFVGGTEFFGFLTVGYITQKARRKPGLLLTIIGSCTAGLMFLIPYVQDQKVMQIIMVVIVRLLNSYYFCFFVITESQILQVQIRSTCFAIIDGTGQLGRVIAPYIINLMYNLKLHPIIAFSIAFIVLGAVPVLMLKETYKKGQVLPEKAVGAEGPSQYGTVSGLIGKWKEESGIQK